MKRLISLILTILILNNMGSQVYAAKVDPDIEAISNRLDSLDIQTRSFYDTFNHIDLKLTTLSDSLNSKIDSAFMGAEITKINQSIDKVRLGMIHNQDILLKKVENLRKDIGKIRISLDQEVDLNHTRTELIRQSLESVSDSLGIQLGFLSDSLEYARSHTFEEINEINTDIDDRTRYWIIASVILIVLIAIVFVTLRYKVIDQRKIFGEEIEKTRKNLQEESIKVDGDLVRLFESQIAIEKESRGDDESTSHALPLKLADEIHKMRKRLGSMDENHNVKVLKKRIESLEDTINDMDYSIEALEGTRFDEGMNIEARFIPDESLATNEQIITRVIRPQVNYKDKMIQSAQVEVSQGV